MYPVNYEVIKIVKSIIIEFNSPSFEVAREAGTLLYVKVDAHYGSVDVLCR